MTKEELVKAISNGLFADRETLEEAFKYVDQVAKASGAPIAVWTAVQIVLNTVAKEIKELKNA